MKVAELLFKNGFKEAYAIRGGVRGEKGWMVCFFHFFFDCTVFFTHRNSLDLSFFSNSSILIYNCFNNGALFRDPYLLILTANDMVRLIG